MSVQDEDLQREELRKLFVGGLSRTTTDDTFRSYFSQFGNITDCVILTDKENNSRGFGFMSFDDSNSIEEVFQARPHQIDGKEVEVKRAMPREFNDPASHSKTTRLFVGGFKGLDFEPDELRNYIESRHPPTIGKILKIDFLKIADLGTNKGFGFMDVSDNDFADRLAIAESTFSLKGRTMSIKKAETKGQGGEQGMRGGRGGARGGMRGGFTRGGGGRGRGRGGTGGGYRSNDYSGGRQQSDNSYGGGYNNQGYNSGGYSQNAGGYDQSGYGNQSGYGSGYGGGYTQGSYNSTGGGYQQQGTYAQSYGTYNQQNGSGAQRQTGGANQRYQPY